MHKPTEVGVVMTRIGEVPWILCASPRYLKEREAPRQPNDLVEHNCITHRSLSPPNTWRFRKGSESFEVRVKGSIYSNSVMILRGAALEAVGIAVLPYYCVDADLAAGTLVPLLKDYIGPARSVYAVYPHAHAPKKVTSFIAFARKQLRANHLERQSKAIGAR